MQSPLGTVVVDQPEVVPKKRRPPVPAGPLPADHRAVAYGVEQGDWSNNTSKSTQMHDYYTASPKPPPPATWMTNIRDTLVGNFLLATLALSLTVLAMR
jgi:hypothetical protein